MKKVILWTLSIAASAALGAIVYRELEPARAANRIPTDRFSTSHASSAPPEAGGHGENAGLSADVAALRGELMAVREQLAQRQPQAPASGTEVSDPDPARAQLEERQARDQAWRGHMASVAAAFRNESKDVTWSFNKASAVRAALDNDASLRDLTRNVECRSRTCRFEIANDPQGPGINQSLTTLAQALTPALTQLQVDHIDDGRGGATMVVYLTGEAQQEPTAPH